MKYLLSLIFTISTLHGLTINNHSTYWLFENNAHGWSPSDYYQDSPVILNNDSLGVNTSSTFQTSSNGYGSGSYALELNDVPDGLFIHDLLLTQTSSSSYDNTSLASNAYFFMDTNTPISSSAGIHPYVRMQMTNNSSHATYICYPDESRYGYGNSSYIGNGVYRNYFTNRRFVNFQYELDTNYGGSIPSWAASEQDFWEQWWGYDISNNNLQLEFVDISQDMEIYGIAFGQGSIPDEFTYGAVPEPSSYALLLGGLALGLVALRRQ